MTDANIPNGKPAYVPPLSHYERHLMRSTMDLRNWHERGAMLTAKFMAQDAVHLIDDLRRRHDSNVADPLIRRILADSELSEEFIREKAETHVVPKSWY